MGTRKLLMALPPMYISLVNGNPYIVDELDAKIHPKLLEYIISLFTNRNVNTKGAQLIFTSHDMYTLSKDVFRRDEVYFVAKDLNDSTFCYSLVDIKNEKNAKERNDSSYSKRYLEGKYGADPHRRAVPEHWHDPACLHDRNLCHRVHGLRTVENRRSRGGHGQLGQRFCVEAG